MNGMTHISALTLRGFKSIRTLENFRFNDLNILLGSNGVGKSNFISFLGMLQDIADTNFQDWCLRQGGASIVLNFGVKYTQKIEAIINFGQNYYSFTLAPNHLDTLFLAKEELRFQSRSEHLPAGLESQLGKFKDLQSLQAFTYQTIKSWKTYHFHDTGNTSGWKQWCDWQDNVYLRKDGANIAAFLWKIFQNSRDDYEKIVRTVRLAVPFFHDFVFFTRKTDTIEQIQLGWKQKGNDYPFHASQLSDGSLRFIGLATALLQPETPGAIIIDEPELGLHPYALTLLAGLMRSASKRTQVIVSTQSVPLVNQFSLEDLVIVERIGEETIFKRPRQEEFQHWLDDYSVGELWEKNILGGRPPQ